MREIPLREARAQLGHLVDLAEHHGQTIVITRYGRPAAQITPCTPEAPMHTITLVSASSGDGIRGLDIAELNPEILAYPEVAEWAAAQGYGPDNPDQCIVILTPEGEVPDAFESLTVKVTGQEYANYIEQLNESGH